MKQTTPRIIQSEKKVLVGKSLSMSYSNNRTRELWQSFMPHRRSIPDQIGSNLISLQVYPEAFDFHPDKEFVKWALVEVENGIEIPEGLERFFLPEGIYAVFNYKGPASDPSIFQYIFNRWLPASGYLLDNRPHFEVLGKNYSNNDPESEEEIWIPVRQNPSNSVAGNK